MLRKVFSVLFSLVFFLSAASVFFAWQAQEAYAAGEEEIVTPQYALKKQEEALDLEELERFIREVDREVRDYLPELSLSRLVSAFKEGRLDLSPRDLLSGIVRCFFHEVAANLSLLGKVLVIALICTVLQNLQSAFERGTVARLAYYVCLLAVITIVLGSFNIAADAGLAAVNRMVSFMKVLLPVLLVLLTAMGGLAGAAIMQPFLLVFLGFMGTFTQVIVFPLIYLHAVLAIANNISEQYKVSRIAAFIKNAAQAGIGLVLTVFVGVVTVGGVAGAVTDGVTLRTAKYMTGAFIPVAGSMFADALDAVIGGSLLLKNAVGLAGVLVLGAIALFPVVKILSIAVIYHLCAALLQPLGDTLISAALDDLAKTLMLVFAAVAGVAIMFFLTITIMVGMANFTVMLR